jgi:hypothetical protein
MQEQVMSLAEAVVMPTGVKRGDIFVSSWGYDQTNVDFYEVLFDANYGQFAKIIELKTQVLINDGGSSMSGYSIPIPREYDGVPMRKKVLKGYQGEPAFKIRSYAYARPWDGKQKYTSWYA